MAPVFWLPELGRDRIGITVRGQEKVYMPNARPNRESVQLGSAGLPQAHRRIAPLRNGCGKDCMLIDGCAQEILVGIRCRLEQLNGANEGFPRNRLFTCAFFDSFQ